MSTCPGVSVSRERSYIGMPLPQSDSERQPIPACVFEKAFFADWDRQKALPNTSTTIAILCIAHKLRFTSQDFNRTPLYQCCIRNERPTKKQNLLRSKECWLRKGEQFFIYCRGSAQLSCQTDAQHSRAHTLSWSYRYIRYLTNSIKHFPTPCCFSRCRNQYCSFVTDARIRLHELSRPTWQHHPELLTIILSPTRGCHLQALKPHPSPSLIIIIIIITQRPRNHHRDYHCTWAFL